MDLVVIVDELGHGSVVATSEHARGSSLRLDYQIMLASEAWWTRISHTLLLIEGLLFGIWSIRTLAHVSLERTLLCWEGVYTIISCSLSLSGPRDVFWRYFNPARISC